MKKVICIVLIVMLCLCLGGCGNNYPTAAYDDLAVLINNTNLSLANSNIEDVVSFRKIMHELAYTIDKGREYYIELLYEDLDDGNVTAIPLTGVARHMNDNEYRKELEANLITVFLDLLQSGKTSVSDHGKLHAVVLNWETYDFFGKISSFALCDFDGDGAWDYGAQDDDNTLSMSFASGSSEEGPKRKINKYNDTYLTCDEEIVELKDLSGNETMSDFEQLL